MTEIILRDYQQDAVAAVRQAYARACRAPLLCSPTGSGKTVIFGFVAMNAVARGGRVLILAHRKELIRQTSATLADFGVDHGLIVPGEPATLHGVQVASVQTIVRRLERLDWAPSLIVVDEAHHATSGSGHGKVLEHFAGAKVLGVTATPARLDGRGLGVRVGGFFDALVQGPSVAELVAAGYLSRPRVFAPPGAPDLSGVRSVAGDFRKSDLAGLMDKAVITGSAVDHYQRWCPGEPAIAFCASVAHAEHVAAAFSAAGYRAASIDGRQDDVTRAGRIADLASGALQVLTSCEIVSEGTDIPVVAAAILLRPTKSLGLFLQQVGRALRPFPGKTHATILDHVGNCHRHGLPDQDRGWDLDAVRRRRDAVAAPSSRECPVCSCVSRPMPACPACGHVFPVVAREIEEREGDLQEIKIAAKAEERRVRAGCKTLDDLRELGQARGYRPGWAENIWRARQDWRPSR